MSKSQASQISQAIGTKTARQVTTHCQKFYEKLQRRCQKKLTEAQQLTFLRQAKKAFNQIPRNMIKMALSQLYE